MYKLKFINDILSIKILTAGIFLFLFSCNQKAETFTLNENHLNHLYKEVLLPNGKQAAIIHIYSQYPDYTYDIEPKEGFACVDDAARALVYYSKKGTDVQKIFQLTEFLLYMQNENGWFNNFVWEDLSINTDYSTSIAEPNWWSWRALWALENALPIVEKNNLELAKRVTHSIDRLTLNVENYLSTLNKEGKNIEGINISNSLPFGSAADQAAILAIGLCMQYERTENKNLIPFIRHLSNGMVKMQLTNSPIGPLFLSWENIWHDWGNSQSYALLKAGESLGQQNYILAALAELDSFCPELLKNKFAAMYSFEKKGEQILVVEKETFPQIAYGVRPIVFAYMEAYNQTQNEFYKTQAYGWMQWFSGNNIANSPMYDPVSGRCYDGILSKDNVNKNSGAESTIEALLSIQAYNTVLP